MPVNSGKEIISWSYNAALYISGKKKLHRGNPDQALLYLSVLLGTSQFSHVIKA